MELSIFFETFKIPLLFILFWGFLISFFQSLREQNVTEALKSFVVFFFGMFIINFSPELLRAVEQENNKKEVKIATKEEKAISIEEKIKRINSFRKKENKNILIPKDEKIIERFEKYAEEKGIKEKIGI
jgi:hypothetical protein